MAQSNSNIFHGVVNKVLSNWTALNLAVEHGMGGPQSRQIASWMVDYMNEIFVENPNIEPYEVSDILSELMDNEFQTICDDNSPDEVGAELCRFFRLLREGQTELLNTELSKLQKCNLLQCKNVSVSSDSENVSASEQDESVGETQSGANGVQEAMELDESAEQMQTDSGNTETQGDSEDMGWTVVKGKRKK